METIKEELEKLPLDILKKNVVGKKIIKECEFELIRRITQKNGELLFVKSAREFFLTDFSYNFLEFIAVSICKEDNAYQIQGEYYEFISKSDAKTDTPYYKLTLFRGLKGSSLQTYVSTITTRYFSSIQRKKTKNDGNTVSLNSFEKSRKKNLSQNVIEYSWFPILICSDNNNLLDYEEETLQNLNKAMNILPERERLVIKMMVMGNASALEAFEDLEPFFAISAKTSTRQWTDKQKQDAVSLLKGRALNHLKRILNK